MEDCVVANHYQTDTLVGYQFAWNGNTYIVKSAPYKLMIQQLDGDVYGCVDVDSYYDFGVFVGDTLFWGERLGKISGFHMPTRERRFCCFIDPEAEAYYGQLAACYPHTFPPKSGDYGYLPEIRIANLIISQLAITAMASYQDYLLVGDLSGRVTIFRGDTCSPVRTFTLEGAVSQITWDGKTMTVDTIRGNRLYTPEALRKSQTAIRTTLEISL